MTADMPGTVFMREYMFSEEISFHALKQNICIDGMFPSRLPTLGLDINRQWYLYKEIAPLCLNGSKACPKPCVPKPKSSACKIQE